MPVEPPVTSTVFPSRSLMMCFLSSASTEFQTRHENEPFALSLSKGRSFFLRRKKDSASPGLDPGSARTDVEERARSSAFYGVSARIERSMAARSEEQQSELQSLMRLSYAVFCL